MDFEYGDNKPRRIMDEDSLTGIDFFSGDEVVDVDDMIDLDVPIKPRFGYELVKYGKDKEGVDKGADEQGYVLGEIKKGIYICESEALTERDARAIMELMPDEHLYMRSK